jgi:hypothetical protein
MEKAHGWVYTRYRPVNVCGGPGGTMSGPCDQWPTELQNTQASNCHIEEETASNMVTEGSEVAPWVGAEENFDFLSGEAPWEAFLQYEDTLPDAAPVNADTLQRDSDLIRSDSTNNKNSADSD